MLKKTIEQWSIPQKKASFSVEAAWIFGISLLLIYVTIALSFHLYKQSKDYVDGTTPKEFDAVKTFRLVQMGEDLFGNRGDENE